MFKVEDPPSSVAVKFAQVNTSAQGSTTVTFGRSIFLITRTEAEAVQRFVKSVTATVYVPGSSTVGFEVLYGGAKGKDIFARGDIVQS